MIALSVMALVTVVAVIGHASGVVLVDMIEKSLRKEV